MESSIKLCRNLVITVIAIDTLFLPRSSVIVVVVICEHNGRVQYREGDHFFGTKEELGCVVLLLLLLLLE